MGLTLAAMRPALGAAVALTLPAIAGSAGRWRRGHAARSPRFRSQRYAAVAWGARQWSPDGGAHEAQAARPAPVCWWRRCCSSVHRQPFLAAMTLVGALRWCAITIGIPTLCLWRFRMRFSLAILYAFDDALTGRLRVGYGYLLLDR